MASPCVPHINGQPTTYEALKKELLSNRELLSKYVDGAVIDAPEMPFKKNWAELSFKRIIRYAAENGFDAVTWDTGEIQAARYDLSKHIDKIEYSHDLDNKTVRIVARKGGEQVIPFTDYAENKLPDVVGKEAAEKILAHVGQEREIPATGPEWQGNPVGKQVVGSLTGIDLKVGGEGMKGFYDQILPSVANDIGKKFGARVDYTSIDDQSDRLNALENKTDAEGLTDREQQEYDRLAEEEIDGTRVHSLPITPEMRESVMTKGQPRFLPRGEFPPAERIAEPPGLSKVPFKGATIPRKRRLEDVPALVK